MGDRDNRIRTKKEDWPVGHLATARGTEISATYHRINIPSTAVGFRIYPTTNAIRFAVDADPSVTEGGFTVNAAGAIAKPGAWETRMLPAGSSTVSVAAVASTTVDIEFF